MIFKKNDYAQQHIDCLEPFSKTIKFETTTYTFLLLQNWIIFSKITIEVKSLFRFISIEAPRFIL
jgi:hypothetical protein